MKTLTLEHLAAYLPYGLKCRYNWQGIDEITHTMENPVNILNSPLTYQDYKPILHPLSDLTKEIEHNGERFVPIEWFESDEKSSFDYSDDPMNWDSIVRGEGIWALEFMPYGMMQKLFEWHFDVFGLIEQGLAIDINELNN